MTLLDIRHARHPFGRWRMCCARTAALQGDEKERRLKRIGVPATINASCHPSACAKNVSKNLPPKPSQALLEGSQEGPELVKNRPRCPRGVQETPKSVQEASKKRPRSAQEAPKSAQEWPKEPTWLHLGGPRPSKIEAET